MNRGESTRWAGGLAAALLLSLSLLPRPVLAEELVYAAHGRRPYDLVVVGEDLYWRYAGSEFCDPGDAGTQPLILGFSPATGPRGVWEGGCDSLSPGRLAADDRWLYFANYVDVAGDGVWRIPRSGAAPELLGAADFVVSRDPARPHQGVPAPGNLAQDEDSLYFSDHGGIQRMDKATGAVTTLVALDGSARVAVDEAAIYWADGGVDDGVWRASKSDGGDLVRLVAAEEADRPFDLAERIARATGGRPLDPAPGGEPPAAELLRGAEDAGCGP